MGKLSELDLLVDHYRAAKKVDLLIQQELQAHIRILRHHIADLGGNPDIHLDGRIGNA